MPNRETKRWNTSASDFTKFCVLGFPVEWWHHGAEVISREPECICEGLNWCLSEMWNPHCMSGVCQLFCFQGTSNITNSARSEVMETRRPPLLQQQEVTRAFGHLWGAIYKPADLFYPRAASDWHDTHYYEPQELLITCASDHSALGTKHHNEQIQHCSTTETRERRKRNKAELT